MSYLDVRCAVPYHRDVQYHITEMCSTISQRCAVPYHRDRTSSCSYFKDCIRCTVGTL